MSDSMTHLENFGTREIEQGVGLLQAYANTNSLPASWFPTGVQLAFNAQSGLVFLTNSEYQALVDDSDYGICMLYSTPYYGNEGTLPQLCDAYNKDDDRWNNHDERQYLLDAIEADAQAFYDNGHRDDLQAVFSDTKAQILQDEAEEHIIEALQAVKETGDDWKIQLADQNWFEEHLYPVVADIVFKDFWNRDSLIQEKALMDWLFEELESRTDEIEDKQ